MITIPNGFYSSVLCYRHKGEQFHQWFGLSAQTARCVDQFGAVLWIDAVRF